MCLIGNNIDGAGIFTVLFDSGKGGDENSDYEKFLTSDRKKRYIFIRFSNKKIFRKSKHETI